MLALLASVVGVSGADTSCTTSCDSWGTSGDVAKSIAPLNEVTNDIKHLQSDPLSKYLFAHRALGDAGGEIELVDPDATVDGQAAKTAVDACRASDICYPRWGPVVARHDSAEHFCRLKALLHSHGLDSHSRILLCDSMTGFRCPSHGGWRFDRRA